MRTDTNVRQWLILSASCALLGCFFVFILLAVYMPPHEMPRLLDWWLRYGVSWGGIALLAPIWFPGVLAVRFLIAAGLLHAIARRRAERGQCPTCGYDLRAGVPEAVCPECGKLPSDLPSQWGGFRGAGPTEENGTGHAAPRRTH